MRQFSQKTVINFGMNFTMRYSRQDFRREIPEDHALRRTWSPAMPRGGFEPPFSTLGNIRRARWDSNSNRVQNLQRM